MPNENPLLEVDPDMHTKFIIFDMEDALMGSFNVTFEFWPDNWEAGMTFTSQAACRLLDNFFQSIRGGMVQKYEINPRAQFNLLYTYGRHRTRDFFNSNYRPNRAIIQEILRAQKSIKVVLFLMGEMIDEGDNVVNSLINAKNRGVDVQVLLNGHVVRVGRNDQPYTMVDELKRPVIPAVSRLQSSGVNVYLVYGKFDQKIPYCPIHSKYCIIDDHIVIDGSFNWYNTSLFSHDMVAVVIDANVARPYIDEFHQIMRDFRVFKGPKLINS